MKRDYMTIGRRPTGLCGAAIVLACRLHEFNYSALDIQDILPCSKDTVQKRILEFKESPVAALTLQEFKNVDLDKLTECDPPCFKIKPQKALYEDSPLPLTNKEEAKECGSSDGLSDMDDEEVDQCILNEDESRLKALM